VKHHKQRQACQDDRDKLQHPCTPPHHSFLLVALLVVEVG
jgi:hypothetical protein